MENVCSHVVIVIYPVKLFLKEFIISRAFPCSLLVLFGYCTVSGAVHLFAHYMFAYLRGIFTYSGTDTSSLIASLPVDSIFRNGEKLSTREPRHLASQKLLLLVVHRVSSYSTQPTRKFLRGRVVNVLAATTRKTEVAPPPSPPPTPHTTPRVPPCADISGVFCSGYQASYAVGLLLFVAGILVETTVVHGQRWLLAGFLPFLCLGEV